MKLFGIKMKRKLNRDDSRLTNFIRYPTSRTFLIVLLACILGFGLATAGLVDLEEVMKNLQWGVLLLYISLDLFTDLTISTGIMEMLAVQLARLSGGRHRSILILFGAFLFLVSSVLNNLSAVQVLLPVLFVLLSAIKLSPFFVASLFSLLLAASNTGGAASLIGDFPALIIMKSGLTDFLNYFLRAFPLFAFTTLVIIAVHLGWLRIREQNSGSPAELLERKLGIDFLGLKYRYAKLKRGNLGLIGLVFCLMFVCWSLLPARRFLPELIAFAGLSLAVVLTAHRGTGLGFKKFDLEPVLNIGSLLFISSVVSSSGIIEIIAQTLQNSFQDPIILLVALMISVAVLTGILSAGPTAAAMMPVVLSLSDGAFSSQKHLLAVAFAASICAGSSLFLWSATAGFLLKNKTKNAKLSDENGRSLKWDIQTYLRFGLIHFAIQLLIGIFWVLIGMRITS